MLSLYRTEAAYVHIAAPLNMLGFGMLQARRISLEKFVILADFKGGAATQHSPAPFTNRARLAWTRQKSCV